MTLRLLSILSSAFLFMTTIGAGADDINDIYAEIRASPFMSTGPEVRDLEIQNGYLFATVFDLSEREVASLRSNLPLSQVLGQGPNLVNLYRLEATLLEEFDLKDIYWTPVVFAPRTRASVRGRFADLLIRPRKGIEDFEIGGDFMTVATAAGAAVVDATSRTREAVAEFGGATFHIFAENGGQISSFKIAASRLQTDGIRGLRELMATSDKFPRTEDGIGIGAPKGDVIAVMNEPEKSTPAAGGCFPLKVSEELLYYPGMRLRLCDEIVTEVLIEQE